MSTRMTWGQLKEIVDTHIKKEGYDDNIVIDYIDIVDPQNFDQPSIKARYGEIEVAIDRDGLAIY